MQPCDRFNTRLPQYVADGEPALPQWVDVRAHLSVCPVCQVQLERLQAVEDALRSYPLAEPDSLMTARIMEGVVEGEQDWQEWEILPWSVWVPAMAVMLALLIASFSIPSQSLPVLATQGGEEVLPAWRGVVAGLASVAQGARFWTIWSGIFVTTAGLGISLALARWDTPHSKSLAQLEQRLSEAAGRLWATARRAD